MRNLLTLIGQLVGNKEEGIQEEINTVMPFISFTAYATLINPKRKSQMYK